MLCVSHVFFFTILFLQEVVLAQFDRAERRRRKARHEKCTLEKCTCEKCTLPTIPLGLVYKKTKELDKSFWIACTEQMLVLLKNAQCKSAT